MYRLTQNRWKILTFILIVLMVHIFLDLQFTNKLKQEKTTKYILYWNKFYNRDDFYLGIGQNIFNHCPINNCFATNNRSLIPIQEFEAILFHGAEYNFQKNDKPKFRSKHQVYVFVDRESPDIYPLGDEFKLFFNWTMTYRLDSDIVWNYGFVQDEKTNYILPSEGQITKKTKKIAWFVSNCHRVSSKRNILYQKIKKYIPVDVYGKCGNLTLDRNKENGFLEENYKFYLSFENSLCKDYVTEKLYKILKLNVIPIVYGGVNYSQFAPPNSVIDIAKFDNISNLVKFIQRLDRNVSDYLKYFQWKKQYRVEMDIEKKVLCELCEKLHQPRQEKIFENMKEWWHGKCWKVPKIVSI